MKTQESVCISNTYSLLLVLFHDSRSANFIMHIGFLINSFKSISTASTHFTRVVVAVHYVSLSWPFWKSVAIMPSGVIFPLSSIENGFRYLHFTLFGLKQSFSFFSALNTIKGQEIISTLRHLGIQEEESIEGAWVIKLSVAVWVLAKTFFFLIWSHRHVIFYGK